MFKTINVNKQRTKIHLKDIEKTLYGHLDSQDTDINIKPNIIIETAKPSYFAVSITIGRNKLMTGVGGFKMFLKESGGLEFYKVSYNGIILNRKERKELYNMYKK